MNANSLSNLRPFPKGVSGNPRGRPREQPHRPTCRALAAARSEDIIAGLLDLAWSADDERVRLGALIELANRADGRPRQEQGGEDDGDRYDDLSDDELERLMGVGDDYTEEELVALEEQVKLAAKNEEK